MIIFQNYTEYAGHRIKPIPIKGKLKIIKSQYYPEFGRAIDNKHLVYDYNGKLPSTITTKISW